MSIDSIVVLAASYTAIPFALVGFGITFHQLAKTKGAAEAALAAARSTQRGIVHNSLLILIPQLQRVEEELERAVQTNSSELVMTWLSNWRWQAGQVRGFLSQSPARSKQILSALQSSIAMAAQVKSEIIDGDFEDLPMATKAAREAIAGVTNELGTLAATHGAEIEGISKRQGSQG